MLTATITLLLLLTGCGDKSDTGVSPTGTRGATDAGGSGGPGGGGPGGGGPGGGGPGSDDTGNTGPSGPGDQGAPGTDDTDNTDTAPPIDTAPPTGIEPPLGETSNGSGGADASSSTALSAGGSSYLLLAPSGSASADTLCFLLVYSGTEGSTGMMSNMRQVAPYFGMEDCLVAVLDGTTSDAADGAAVLDDVRASFDVDNDRTWLLSESAGTREGLALGFDLRQSYFAAYWANDVNAAAAPALTADDLGFAPWGNSGPGGDLPDANTIVDGMRDAGYRLPSDAPYSGSGSTTHGSSDQFLAAVDFFADKRRE